MTDDASTQTSPSTLPLPTYVSDGADRMVASSRGPWDRGDVHSGAIFRNHKLEAVCTTHSMAPSRSQRSIKHPSDSTFPCYLTAVDDSPHRHILSLRATLYLSLDLSRTMIPASRALRGMCDERLSRRRVCLLNVLSESIPHVIVKSRVGMGRRPSPASSSLFTCM
ncbi:hypothetical protein P3342_002634 [Pyrenophora teres f. teres]|nr:hypothetical protein P3342_002634 [Pyrenophora teres f. teres]